MRHLFRTIVASAIIFLLPVTAVEAVTVTLQWDANQESDARYYLSYGTASGVYTARLDAGQGTTFSVNINPTAVSQTYYFAVQAYSVNGISAYSTEASTVIAPSQAKLTIDRPGTGSVNPSDVLLSGWAVDPASTTGTGVDSLHVYAYPNPGSGAKPIFLGVAAYGSARPDVAAALGASRYTASGFSLPIIGLTPGVWEIVVFARSTYANAFTAMRSVRITVHGLTNAPAPTGATGAIGLPALNSTVTGWLSIGGWAVDRRATSGTGVDVVQVWAYPAPGSGTAPIFLGNAAYGRARSDVGGIFGSRFVNSGFHLDVSGLAANLYDIVILGRSTVSGAFEIARVTRVYVNPAAVITVDSPSHNGVVGSSFAISGWTFDRRATVDNGIDSLHVWAYRNPGSNTDPIFLGVANTGLPRADVAAAFGARNALSGFSLPLSGLTAGVYDIVLFAHSSVTNSFDNARVIRVTVR